MAIDRDKARRDLGLPIRPFMYTLDQIATMLNMSERALKVGYCYFDGIHSTKPSKSKLHARNINPQGETPEWRVAEKELIRWLKFMGFRIIEPRTLSV